MTYHILRILRIFGHFYNIYWTINYLRLTFLSNVVKLRIKVSYAITEMMVTNRLNIFISKVLDWGYFNWWITFDLLLNLFLFLNDLLTLELIEPLNLLQLINIAKSFSVLQGLH